MQKITPSKWQATSGLTVEIPDPQGRLIVLYFYPKDDTPGCTLEGQDFRDNYEAFVSANAVIFGVSRDSIASHEKFKTKQSFPFELISDIDESLCKLFDVLKPKSMFGKSYIGVERATFIINQEGEVIKQWDKVTVKGHVDEVLAAVRDA